MVPFSINIKKPAAGVSGLFVCACLHEVALLLDAHPCFAAVL